jgi:hypothetical protein
MVGKPLPESAREQDQLELARAITEHTAIGGPTAYDDRPADAVDAQGD